MFATKEISGGGGVAFNPSITVMLGKAKLKEDNAESKKAEMNTTGIIVTSRPRKNRFARPIPVRFHISFFKGMNKYTGLEKYISWDSCGIAKGELHDEKSYAKWKDETKANYDLEKYSWIQTDEEGNEKRWYFWPKDTARSIVVKHLSAKLPAKEMFTPEVITEDILRQIDENEIKPLFMLPDIASLDDLAELADEIDNEDME